MLLLRCICWLGAALQKTFTCTPSTCQQNIPSRQFRTHYSTMACEAHSSGFYNGWNICRGITDRGICFSCTVRWVQTHACAHITITRAPFPHKTPFPFTVIGSDNESDLASALALSQQRGAENSQLMELALLSRWRLFCLSFGVRTDEIELCNEGEREF